VNPFVCKAVRVARIAGLRCGFKRLFTIAVEKQVHSSEKKKQQAGRFSKIALGDFAGREPALSEAEGTPGLHWPTVMHREEMRGKR